MDFIPETSALQLNLIDTKDKDVQHMAKYLGIKKLIPGLAKKQ